MKGLESQVNRVVEEVSREVKKACIQSLNQVLNKTVADIKEDISVPVVRIGGNVIRSQPGEPPRKDTGKLHKGVGFERPRLSGNSKVISGLYSFRLMDTFLDSNVPAGLEFGMSRSNWGVKVLPRPYFFKVNGQSRMKKTRDRLISELLDRIKSI
ncbi:MAG: hypothetical protein KatS3mg104_3053 [Phycisphaerae bacterium]|nr:MAG: hypothetical protein KatS3mg104_3053 [Phycisphaerae bacterium]